MLPQTIDLAPLCVRADVGTISEDTRTVDLIFSTGAPTVRMDYWTGKRYIEVLSMKPEHVRLDRLNAGAPLLDSHSAYSIGSILGTTEPNTARIEGGKGHIQVRFPKAEDDPEIDRVYRKVRDKIIRNVSIGYRVHKFLEEQGKADAMPKRTAIDWEPFEVSMVPMPIDVGARVRGLDKSLANPCVIETRGFSPDDADRLRRFRLAQQACAV